MSYALRREQHYGNRIVTCFADRCETVDALFRAAVDAHPERIALVAGARRISYRDLDRDVNAVAAHLAAAGLEPGQRLALLVGNRPEFLVTVLAAARSGLIVVPLGTRQSQPEIAFVLDQCSARAIVYETDLATVLPERTDAPGLHHWFAIGEGGRNDARFDQLLVEGTPPARIVREEDDFCLLYTSGTTGRPKGARLTHLGVMHSVLNYRHGLGLEDGDVSVLAVPASHVTGLVAILLSVIGVAGTSVFMADFKARHFLELAARERMTHALLVPAMYNLCLLDPLFADLDLSTWRIGGFGGAPMPEATIERLAEALPRLDLRNIYGSTETTSPVTMMPPGAIASHRDTVGKPLPCADIVVMDESGRALPANVAGELWIGGPMVIPGYWDNAAADAENFCAGYWKSGDIGSIDDEGFVRILDRRKDVINRGGYKIYSIEVENALAQHPDVREVAVVPKPDPVLGELVHAFVVARGAGIDIGDLRAQCRKELSDYKVPAEFTVLDALPRNANGKVLKRDLQARLKSAPLGS